MGKHFGSQHWAGWAENSFSELMLEQYLNINIIKNLLKEKTHMLS